MVNERDILLAYNIAKHDLLKHETISKIRILEYDHDLKNNLNNFIKNLNLTIEREDALSLGDLDFMLRPISYKKPYTELGHHELGEIHYQVIENLNMNYHVLFAYWMLVVGTEISNIIPECVYGDRIRNDWNKKDASNIGIMVDNDSQKIMWVNENEKQKQNAIDSSYQLASMKLKVNKYNDHLDLSALRDAYVFSSEEHDDVINKIHEISISELNDICAHLPTESKAPEGLSIAELLSNYYTSNLDVYIKSTLNPIYYSRYKDEVFLLLPITNDLIAYNFTWIDIINDRVWPINAKRVSGQNLLVNTIDGKYFELSKISCEILNVTQKLSQLDSLIKARNLSTFPVEKIFLIMIFIKK